MGVAKNPGISLTAGYRATHGAVPKALAPMHEGHGVHPSARCGTCVHLLDVPHSRGFMFFCGKYALGTGIQKPWGSNWRACGKHHAPAKAGTP